MRRDRNFAGFLGQAFELAGANIQAIAIFVVILAGVNTFGLMMGLIEAEDTIAGMGFGFMIEATDGLATAAYEIGAAVLTIVMSYFLLAQFLESAGRLPDRSTRIWAYVGLSILGMLGMVLGLMLLIVPGIILMVRWAASSGYLIGARTGIVDALGQSWEATRGHSWPIFFAGLVLFLGIAIFSGAIAGAAGFSEIQLLIAATSSVAEALANALMLAFGIGVYILIHDDTEETADVFA